MHAVAGLAVFCMVSGIHTGIRWRDIGWFTRAAFVALAAFGACVYVYASTGVAP